MKKDEKDFVLLVKAKFLLTITKLMESILASLLQYAE